MKTKYYLSGTVLGLCLVPLMAIYIMQLRNVLRLLSEGNFLLPVITGYGVALAVSALADRFIRRHGIIVTVLVLVMVFVTGAFFGCAMNFLLNGELSAPRFGLYNEAWSWFGKPAYWLVIIGAPCAAIVAIMHYFAQRLYDRWRCRGEN